MSRAEMGRIGVASKTPNFPAPDGGHFFHLHSNECVAAVVFPPLTSGRISWSS
jgi:hypothetical protein